MHHVPNPEGVLSQKFGGGARPASQNPSPIHDQNLRFPLLYLWPGENFDIMLFMTMTDSTVAQKIIYEGLLLLVLLIEMKKWLLLKNILNSRLTTVQNPYVIY